MAVLPAQVQLLLEGLIFPPLALQLGPGRLLGRRREAAEASPQAITPIRDRAVRRMSSKSTGSVTVLAQ